MTYLSDPALDTLIGIFVTILVAMVIYLLQRNRKEITFEVISDTLILSIGEEIKNKVQVIFGNKHISDARLVVFRIFNSGNVPILPTDYMENIKFTFGQKSEVLDAEILESKPTNIKAFITHETNKVILEPVLLNSQESIKFKVLLINSKVGTANIAGRIVGINRNLNIADKRINPKPNINYI